MLPARRGLIRALGSFRYRCRWLTWPSFSAGEVTLIEKTTRLQHDKLLAALFIRYGGAHLLVTSFMWLIVLALVGEGYSYLLREPRTLALVGVSSLAVLPPLSGYSLLRGRWWARRAVMLTCSVMLLVSSAVVFKILQTGWSANRIAFVILYGGASAGLCLYGAWVVTREGAA
jgi:hypothetical protein